MKSKRGFTLIELLLVVGLIAAVSLLMYSFFGQGFRLYSYESESANEQTNIRQVLSDITNKARLTDPSLISCESNVLSIGSYTYSLSGENVTRSGTAIASGIAYFIVYITENILYIDIISTSGTEISTSFSLVSPQV